MSNEIITISFAITACWNERSQLLEYWNTEHSERDREQCRACSRKFNDPSRDRNVTRAHVYACACALMLMHINVMLYMLFPAPYEREAGKQVHR